MITKIEFQVTEKAGIFVAGRRSPGAGKTLMLTEAEAHHAEMMGELLRIGEKPGAKAKAATKVAADLSVKTAAGEEA